MKHFIMCSALGLGAFIVGIIFCSLVGAIWFRYKSEERAWPSDFADFLPCVFLGLLTNFGLIVIVFAIHQLGCDILGAIKP